jgi:hypothetical protein
MDILLSIFALLLSAIGIIGCVVPVIPGPVLSYVGLLCAYGCSYSTCSANILWLWALITLAVTVMDYLLPGYMTRIFGGTRSGSRGATVGVLVGLLVGGLVGVIVGPFVGAVAGELLHDSTRPGRALKVGCGSFLSFIVGTGVKLVVCVQMLLLVLRDTAQLFQGVLSVG